MSAPDVAGGRVRDYSELPDLTIAAHPQGAPLILLDGVWLLGDEPINHVPNGAVVLRIGGGS